ncbi:hypothetical protein QW180_00245 [Vibrio sinaloensis]|nr:hypothetical protein [Vibrio sinaloensis]
MSNPPSIHPHSHKTELSSVRLCQGCELPVDVQPLEKKAKAPTVLVAALNYTEVGTPRFQVT